MEGRAGPQHAQTRQNLHIHRGPVYTWGKEQGPLHKRRGAGFHCTHTRGVEFLCQHRERERRGRGMVLLCTHREGLWILTGIPGSPEGPASPSSPALPCRSEESENAMSPLSTLGALPAVPPFSGEKAATHRFSLLAFGPSSAREPLQDRNQGQGQGSGSGSGLKSRLQSRLRLEFGLGIGSEPTLLSPGRACVQRMSTVQLHSVHMGSVHRPDKVLQRVRLTHCGTLTAASV